MAFRLIIVLIVGDRTSLLIPTGIKVLLNLGKESINLLRLNITLVLFP